MTIKKIRFSNEKQLRAYFSDVSKAEILNEMVALLDSFADLRDKKNVEIKQLKSDLADADRVSELTKARWDEARAEAQTYRAHLLTLANSPRVAQMDRLVIRELLAKFPEH